jgi:DNA-binding NtrC family response regulator
MRTEVLLLGETSDLHALLDDAMREAGFNVKQVATCQAALPLLRTSPTRLVVLMGTRCGMGLLEAAEYDALVGRHGFVLVTALWDMLPAPWHNLTCRLQVPVVPKPFDLHHLLATVAQAAKSEVPAIH